MGTQAPACCGHRDDDDEGVRVSDICCGDVGVSQNTQGRHVHVQAVRFQAVFL
jgi:hypothetical protein